MDLRRIVVLVIVVGVALAAWDVLKGDEGLRAMAARVACRHTTCRTTYERRHRDPFGWTYTFIVHRDVVERTEVSCSKAWFLAGPYTCQIATTRGRGE